MKRLLGPTETKFWLLDVAAPMNVVAALEIDGTFMPSTINALHSGGLPVAICEEGERPFWSENLCHGRVETLSAPDDPFGWLPEAEALLQMRVGTQGHPAFHARILQGGTKSTILLALNHALADYRAALEIARCLLEGRTLDTGVGTLEELLPEEAFSDPEAGDIIDSWWSQGAAMNWRAAGLDRLVGMFPKPGTTRLKHVAFNAMQSAELDILCQRTGASLNSLAAVAIRDAMGIDEISHAVDMTRALADARQLPSLAVSHVRTQVPVGASPLDVRETLHARLSAKVAADDLLVLPKALNLGRIGASAQPARAGITSAPKGLRDHIRPNGAEPIPITAQCVVSAARGGGFVLNIVRKKAQIHLITCLTDADSEGTAQKIAIALTKMIDSARSLGVGSICS